MSTSRLRRLRQTYNQYNQYNKPPEPYGTPPPGSYPSGMTSNQATALYGQQQKYNEANELQENQLHAEESMHSQTLTTIKQRRQRSLLGIGMLLQWIAGRIRGWRRRARRCRRNGRGGIDDVGFQTADHYGRREPSTRILPTAGIPPRAAARGRDGLLTSAGSVSHDCGRHNLLRLRKYVLSAVL
jgi:hypothetical protein